MNDQDEIFEAATETPASMGCPSLVSPRIIVHDEPAKAKGQDLFEMPNGFRLARFANTETVKLIGKYRISDPRCAAEPNRVCEVEIRKRHKRGVVRINGKPIFEIYEFTNNSVLERAAVKSLKAYLAYKIKSNKHGSDRRKRRRADNSAQQKGGAK